MDRRSFIRSLAASTLAWSILPAQPSTAAAESAADSLTDLMPDFFRIYAQIADIEDAQLQILTLGRGFFLQNAEIFTAAGFNGGSHGRFYDSRVSGWLGQVATIVDAMRRVSAQAPADWKSQQAKFVTLFPDYAGARGFFLVSLFSFDGYISEFRGVPAAFFGMDTIARRGGDPAALKVLFDHETFHLYHHQVSPTAGPAPLWNRIWREGLATYASAKLNSQATLREVFLGTDPMDYSDDEIVAAAALALASPDEIRGAALNSLLDAAPVDGRRPRTGYLLGFAAAQEAGRERDLAALVRQEETDTRRFLQSTLAKLATGEVRFSEYLKPADALVH